MNVPTISVLMSTYNETAKELDESICSILGQSYSDFEFLIINDNPSNDELTVQLQNYDDNRIRIIKNKENMGLVKSLNQGLQLARGKYIARMDADDVSKPTRLKDELLYLQENNLDMIGSFVETIDENDKVIKSVMKFPVKNNEIVRFMRWGSCICHPSWFLKKQVYSTLQGYRMAPHCEDYDFILRAIFHGYKVGNIPKVELSYRIRQSGVSKSNEAEQFLLRDFLAKNMKKIDKITEEEIEWFLHSGKFDAQLSQLTRYKEIKQNLKKQKDIKNIEAALLVPANYFFWRDIVEKTTLFVREHL